MDDLQIAARFGVALLLGFLLGLERERTRPGGSSSAGVRTFTLVALAGALATWMQVQFALSWLVPAAFIGVAGLIAVSYYVTASPEHPGFTTEVSCLVAFLLGALCAQGDMRLASVLGVATVLLLSARDWLHALAHRIDAQDVEAALKFAVISVIILPLVPDKSFGPPPFDVLNPYRIWRIVVLISAMDFVGWVLVRHVGREHGIGITGLLGGLVSSTAATLEFVKRSRKEPELSRALAFGTLLAWTVMFVRVPVLVAISTAGSGLLLRIAPVIGVMGVVSLGSCALLWKRSHTETRGEVKASSNPFELMQAVKFGLLFGVVMVIARSAEIWLGSGGIRIAGFFAGLTDVDAITLSMSELANREQEKIAIAAAAIGLAVIANTLVKGGIAVVSGSPGMRRALLPWTAVMVVAGVVTLIVF